MTPFTPAIDEIYWHASQKASPAERAEYLDSICQDNQQLRLRVERLLELQPQAEQFLEAPKTVSMGFDERPVEAVGTVLGPYKLLEQIGQGGMGVVFMAEQQQPVRRKVALKILKPGLDTYEIVGRFEQERQALAIMEHPHIARVFDAGTSPAGRPFFVMELVRGVSITKFCTEKQLGSQQRLRLMIQVCHAVQHAHQKGIIHRDLKPSNVMVELHDVTPVPKVIDFGVAKALHGRLIDRTLFTRYVQMIGTPLYMSPEQTELNGLDADTRSDVYSLGVLLYELLTGSTPFDRQRIRDAGFDEMRRILREEEPPRPSTRISTLNAAGQATVSGTLAAQSPGFPQRLRHELDWVVMKALEKDRTRRYQSASDLAADIERFLNDEPVLARPPSVTYRLTKLARRHKAILTTIVAVTLALSLGTAVSLWQAWRATDAQRLAEHRAVIAEQATANAKRQEARADAARRQSDERLYVADMKLASDAVRNGDIPRAASLLARHRPDTASTTIPGFEWRYLNRLIDVRPEWRTNVGAWARCVRLSPNGTLLAIAARDGSVQIRDARDGRILQRFGSLSETNSVAWSPDGLRIASAAVDGAVRLWNVETSPAAESSLLSNLVSALTDRPAQVIAAHEGAATDAMFTPDAGTLMTTGADGKICLWNAETGEPLATLTGHSREVEQLAVSPDGTLVASASSDGTVVVWDLNGRRKRFSSREVAGRMVCVSFSPDGGLVAAGDIDGNLLVCDVEAEKWTQVRLVDGIESVAFLDNPLRVVTGDRGGSMQLWKLKHEPGTAPEISDTPLARWIAHQGRVQALVVNRRDEMMLTGSRDGTVAAWLIEASTPGWQWPGVADFCLVADDKMIVGERELLLVDLQSRKLMDAFLPSESGWILVVKSRDSPRIAVASDHTIVIYDLAMKREVLRQNFKTNVHRLAISPDGTRIAVAWWDNRTTIDVFHVPISENTGSGVQTTRSVFSARQCSALEFSLDNRRLAVGHMDDVLVYDVSGTALETTGGIPSASLADNADENESYRRSPVLHLTGHDSTLTDVAFSPDGSLLATVSSDRHLMLWNSATAQKIAAVPAHHAAVNSVAFSADGRTIATTGDDGAVRLWRTATLQPLLELPLPTDRDGRRVMLTAEGSRLLVCTSDDRILVHDTQRSQAPEVPAVAVGNGGHLDQTLQFQGLGDLPGGEFYSNTLGLSSDGRFVVGHSRTALGYDLFRWSESDGIQRIGPVRPQVGNTDAGSVSDDGTVICGAGAVPSQRGFFALLWPTPDSVVRIAPGPSAAQDISADGKIVVGRQRVDETWTAFRWTLDGLQSLPLAPGHRHGEAHAVTRDGTMVLGTMFNHPGLPTYQFADFRRWQNAQPVIWEGDETRPLPEFDPDFNWHATDLSDDGRVVTGVRWPQGEHRNGIGSRAFVWQAGDVTLLEPLPGCQATAAAGVSGDGRIIVGSSEYLRGTTWEPVACAWDVEHGTCDLQQWLARQGVAVNWRLQHSRAISRDGRIIIGVGINPQGQHESWRLRVPDGTFEP